MHTQVCVIQEGQKLVLNVMLQESPPTDLYYLHTILEKSLRTTWKKCYYLCLV